MNLMTPSSLLVATRNDGKSREFHNMLSNLPLRIVNLESFPNVVDVEEVGQSFRENAVLKARGYSFQTGLLTLADDSGLEVEGLGGAPGIMSARFAGDGASDAERTKKLLTALSSTSDMDRRARFVCAIAIFDSKSNSIRVFEGKCDGRIAHAPHGTNGFGYDPIFIPDGYSETFGSMDAAMKQKMSHRGRAIRAARDFLAQLSEGTA